LPEILDDMQICHTQLGTIDAMIDYLQQAITRYAGISPVLALAEIMSHQKGNESAAEFITGEISKRPSVRGLSRLIDLNLSRAEGVAHANLSILKNMTDQLLENKPVYKCRDCGFYGKALHWQCPGCKHWNTVKPIHGVEGE
jgi:lipopolysaccharide biosynthesis regulator YciM